MYIAICNLAHKSKSIYLYIYIQHKNQTSCEHVARGFWAIIFSHLVQKRAGNHVVLPEASAGGQSLCLNRWNGMVPATDSLDHRDGACYLPCGLHAMNIVMHVDVHSLLVPPSALLKHA